MTRTTGDVPRRIDELRSLIGTQTSGAAERVERTDIQDFAEAGRWPAAPGGGLVSTRLMLHLLAGRRLKTARHPQTEHLAQLLSLAGPEPLPQLRQR